MGNRNQRFGMCLGSAIPLIAISLLFCAAAARSLPIPGLSPQQAGAVPLSQGITGVADKLAKSVPEGHPMTVAVTDFPDLGGQTCRLGRYVAERLSTLLSQHPQCRLIERRRLDMVLQELKFSMSELVDPAKARRLGQMLGVQGLVIGTISDVGSTLDVDARIIDIQTDVSLPGASASIVKDEAVNRMSTQCGSAVERPVQNELPQPPLPPPSEVKPVLVEGIKFEAKACEMSEISVTCRLLVTNVSPEDQDVMFLPCESRMLDNSGNEAACRRFRIGMKDKNEYYPCGVKYALVSGIRTNMAVTFDKASADATRIALLKLKFKNQRGDSFIVQARNVQLSK